MNNLVKLNPIREMSEFQNEIARLFGSSIHTMDAGMIPLDVIENDSAMLVKAAIPGINPDDIEITLTNNLLTIQGEIKEESITEGETYHLRERRAGSFSRSLKFRTPVDSDSVEASYDHGILSIHIPKTENAKPKRITIKNNVA